MAGQSIPWSQWLSHALPVGRLVNTDGGWRGVPWNVGFGGSGVALEAMHFFIRCCRCCGQSGLRTILSLRGLTLHPISCEPHFPRAHLGRYGCSPCLSTGANWSPLQPVAPHTHQVDAACISFRFPMVQGNEIEPVKRIKTFFCSVYFG